MSPHKNTSIVICALVLAVSFSLSGAAHAQTGWLWYDSVFAAPLTAQPSRVQSVPVKRNHATRSAVVAPTPIRVSAVASNSDCFWCNRRIYISGLSF